MWAIRRGVVRWGGPREVVRRFQWLAELPFGRYLVGVPCRKWGGSDAPGLVKPKAGYTIESCLRRSDRASGMITITGGEHEQATVGLFATRDRNAGTLKP
jgi:hypothetical protein